jgi:hypothetical protein
MLRRDPAVPASFASARKEKTASHRKSSQNGHVGSKVQGSPACGSREGEKMFVTAEDFRGLKDRYQDFPRIDNKVGIDVYDELIERVQPRIVIAEPGGSTKWFEAVTKTRHAIAMGERGLIPGYLDELAGLVEKYFLPASHEPHRRMDFILKKELRDIAEDDWSRAVSAGQREDAKTAAIAGGSVVEALALDILERLAPSDTLRLRDSLNALPSPQRRDLRPERSDSPEDWAFAYVLLSLGPDGLKVLSERTHDIGHQLRDWRNYVHPAKSRSQPRLSAADGRLALGFAEKVLEEVSAWHAARVAPVVP